MGENNHQPPTNNQQPTTNNQQPTTIMLLNWIDKIGDLNPQLLREIKGRLNSRNVAIAIVVSVIGQLLVYLSWFKNMPGENYYVYDTYCKLRPLYESSQQQLYRLQDQYRQLQQQFAHFSGSQNYNPEKIEQLKNSIKTVKGNIADLTVSLSDRICPLDQIDLQGWLQDQYRYMFVSLSLLVLFSLLVIGTYMLISNLGHEERRGTLNFIRLSPQSTQSFWLGKLLGVPVLLYVAILLTIPLHIWSGLSAQMPLVEILSFWMILGASCAFFYSAALLFGLFGSWFSGFQAWLGSGAVLTFLWIVNFKPIDHSSMDWLNLFSPSVVFPYLIDRTGSSYTMFPFNQGQMQGLEFFNFPLGENGLSVVILALVNYALWTYWIGQALNRQFRNPSATLLSKRHSYLLTACWIVFTLGFALQAPRPEYSSQFVHNFNSLLPLNLVLFLGLIAALSPQRQALQDWARYRHQGKSTRQGFWKSSLVRDLLWGDKSPSVLAIAINLLITALPLMGWILFWSVEVNYKLEAFFTVIFSLSVILIYAAIAQLMLLMKTPKRAIWATGTLIAVISLPPIILTVLSIYPGQNGGGLWLLTAFPWSNVMQYASPILILQAILIQVGVLGVLNWQLTRQLGRAGESASKALFAGRSSMSN